MSFGLIGIVIAFAAGFGLGRLTAPKRRAPLPGAQATGVGTGPNVGSNLDRNRF